MSTLPAPFVWVRLAKKGGYLEISAVVGTMEIEELQKIQRALGQTTFCEGTLELEVLYKGGELRMERIPAGEDLGTYFDLWDDGETTLLIRRDANDVPVQRPGFEIIEALRRG